MTESGNNVEKLVHQLLDEQQCQYKNGNGRVGRLLLFKDCLAYGHLPFIIDEDHKLFYYRGLREFYKEPGFLTDTCLSAQDKYRAYCQKLVKDFT